MKHSERAELLSVVLNIIRNETLIGNREIKCSITYLPTHSFAVTDPHVKDKFNLLKLLEDSVFLLKYFMVYFFFFFLLLNHFAKDTLFTITQNVIPLLSNIVRLKRSIL